MGGGEDKKILLIDTGCFAYAIFKKWKQRNFVSIKNNSGAFIERNKIDEQKIKKKLSII